MDNGQIGADTTVQYWDRRFSSGGTGGAGVRVPKGSHPQLRAALDHFGDIRDRTVIDLGCGRGEASLWFAKRGARVISVDTSHVAVDNLRRYCDQKQIDTVDPRCLSAMDIDQLGSQDLVYGSMILHHLEPFSEFARKLREAVRPGGRAFFYENNAASRTMVWFRRHVVGKLWVPKYGDDDEFPLTPDEVDELRKHFTVEQSFPELLYVELASSYLTRGKLDGPARRIDEQLHKIEPLRKYSYRQQLKLS